MKTYGLLVTIVAFTAPAWAQPKWFAPDATAKQALENGLDAARKTNHRLLVMYGGNWCTHCAEAHEAAMADTELPQLVHSAYEVVMVETDDAAGLGRFAAENLHTTLDKADGLLITLLDQDGTLLRTFTGAWIMDNGHISTAKLKPALREFVLGATAAEAYRTALESLPEDKTGWVEFRADWCGWCKRMESFFRTSDAAPVLAKYYQVIAIDTEKNVGADKLARSLGAKDGVNGIPWFAAIDRNGKVLATSEGPKGNIGYPDTDVEVAHFMSVLKTTAKGITASELDTVASTIKALKAKAAATAPAAHN